MPAAVRAVGATDAGAANITVTYPTRQNNDILLLFVETASTQPVVTVTAGAGGGTWNLITQFSNAANSSDGSALNIYWSRWTTGQATSVTITDTGDHQIGGIVSISGCVTTGTPFEGLNTATAAAATPAIIPAVTTTRYGTLIVGAITSSRDANFTTEFSNYTNSNLTSITEQFDAGTNAGNGGGFGVFSGFWTGVGSTGTTSVTIANSTVTCAAAFAMIGTDSLLPHTGWGIPIG